MVYFHYPEFCRKPQLELAETLRSAAHTLPLVRQLLPDVPVAYDDDATIPGLTSSSDAGHCWLVCCGSIFLLHCASGKIYASADATLFPLLHRLLEDTGREWGCADAEDQRADAMSTGYDHVRLSA